MCFSKYRIRVQLHPICTDKVKNGTWQRTLDMQPVLSHTCCDAGLLTTWNDTAAIWYKLQLMFCIVVSGPHPEVNRFELSHSEMHIIWKVHQGGLQYFKRCRHVTCQGMSQFLVKFLQSLCDSLCDAVNVIKNLCWEFFIIELFKILNE